MSTKSGNAHRNGRQMPSHSSWPGIAVGRTASLPLAYARPSTSSFALGLERTWMAGASPGMTVDGVTILAQPPLAENINRTPLDGQGGRAVRRLDAERHHQRPRRAAVGHRDGVPPHLIVPVAHPRLHRDIA